MIVEPGAFGDDIAHGSRPLMMPAHALQPALDGPAPIAVHDDGDVPGESFGGNVFEGAHRHYRFSDAIVEMQGRQNF
jgi:hypothetical protein